MTTHYVKSNNNESRYSVVAVCDAMVLPSQYTLYRYHEVTCVDCLAWLPTRQTGWGINHDDGYPPDSEHSMMKTLPTRLLGSDE